jgi:hypothetical protein
MRELAKCSDARLALNGASAVIAGPDLIVLEKR